MKSSRFKIAFVSCIIICMTSCGRNAESESALMEITTSPPSSDPPDCECCVFDEAGKPGAILKIAADTAKGQRIVIRGTVYHSDAKTPAANTLMYFYHTDRTGHYSKHGNEDRSRFAWWHGYNRGFLITDSQGRYEINTIQPAPYPGNVEPAHIHSVVQSPDQKRCANIADFVFTDDSLLTAKFWNNTASYWKSLGIDDNPNYGGVSFDKSNPKLWQGKRDIVLFDEFDLPKIESGNPIGSESPAFMPQHAAGPDKGSHACPMCKYGYHAGVMLFLNSDSEWKNAALICKRLEEESIRRKAKKFKAYLIYTNPEKLSAAQLETKLSEFADSLSLKNMAITYVPSINDKKAEMDLNNINPKTKSTLIVYNNRIVLDKFVDFVPSDKNFTLLFNSVDVAEKSKLELPKR